MSNVSPVGSPRKTSNLRIHVVQESPTSRGIDKNAGRIKEILRECEADLVLLPELFLSGYQIESLDQLGLDLSDAVIRDLSNTCAEAHVGLIVGFIERGSIGQYFNSTLAIDQDGSVRDPIRKTHLYGKERSIFEPGNILEPISLCGRDWGIINCFEVEFPEVARTLATKGAEGFLIVSSNMRPYVEDHVIAVRARSKENRLPAAYSNRIGRELGYEFCGRSMVVDHDGNVIHAMDENSESAITVSLTIGLQAEESVSMLEQMRPELYKL